MQAIRQPFSSPLQFGTGRITAPPVIEMPAGKSAATLPHVGPFRPLIRAQRTDSEPDDAPAT
jgi:hypothetical protein